MTEEENKRFRTETLERFEQLKLTEEVLPRSTEILKYAGLMAAITVFTERHGLAEDWDEFLTELASVDK